MVHAKTFILQLGSNSPVPVHSVMLRKDLFHSGNQDSVLLILVFLPNAVVVRGPAYAGDFQQDLQLIFLPQFLHNGYFFFRCRAFLA